MLTPEQQERFSRHLLLDGLGGRGQERLCAGAAEIALPAALAWCALGCARALAASGLARLWLAGDWAEGPLGQQAREECARIAPEVQVTLGPAPRGTPRIGLEPACDVALRSPGLPAGSLAPSVEQAGPAAQLELGAQAALEMLKLLAGLGAPATRPLQIAGEPRP